MSSNISKIKALKYFKYLLIGDYCKKKKSIFYFTIEILS
jgi:hypothetical protein